MAGSRGLRMFASRRWLIFALVVVLLAILAWQLGQWQFSRLDDRRDRNAVIRTNEALSPAPVESVMQPGSTVAPGDEWRRVTATGTYAVEDTVTVRYRTRDGLAGVNVVVPLVTDSGTALLVDRGWVRTENRGVADPDEVPEPPSGTVTVVAYTRADGEGAATQVDERSTRAINSAAIGEAIDRPVYGGFAELVSENGEPADELAPVELPELNDGPHFFYGLQWWFFGLLALVGFGWLARDELRNGPRGDRPRRKGSEKPPTGTDPTRRPLESSRP